MPIYEYRCEDCGTKFEQLVRNSEQAAGLACPKCGQNRLTTELSTFAAHGGGSPGAADGPMCPGGGPCSTPGLCGMN